MAFILAAMLSCASIALAQESTTGNEYAYRIAVEQHLESRINSALREVTGMHGIIAFVSAETSSESSAPSMQSGSGQRPLLLPGVPAKDDIKLPVMPSGGSVLVKRLSVTVLVDVDTPKPLTDAIHEVVVSLMGYNAGRGDRIEIKRVSFKKEPFQWKSVIYPPMVFIAALAVFGTIFLIAATAFLLMPKKSLSLSLKEPLTQHRQSEPHVQPQQYAAQVAAVHARAEETSSPAREAAKFSFLNDSNIAEAAYLMRESQNDDIAIVANYLGAELSARFLSYFPVERQAEAASMLGASREFRHETVDELERGLRERLSYVIGGEERLASLLSIADDEVRERTIEAIERKDYNSALRLREKVRSFESIVRSLDQRSLESLVMRFEIPALARILNSSAGDVQARLLESVSSGASERIREEMKYAGALPPERLKHEKLRFIALYRRMSDAGELSQQKSQGF